MKRFLVILLSCGVLGAAALFSAARQDAATPAAKPEGFQVEQADKNPWTSLSPNTDAEQFQFAVISDRTGGHRRGVFSKAVRQINLLQPEFVMSVGDLIEGSRDAEKMSKEWTDFEGYVKQFQMPFFYCAGNHDADNPVKMEVWGKRYGKAYYHFTYKNCLFMVQNSNDAEGLTDLAALLPRGPRLAKTQLAEIEAVLKSNPSVRHTFVFLHHPVWTARDLTANGWLEFEKLFAGRNHNVFCGHVHNYRKFLRNGTSYYQLATTGGASALRGIEYGEFDQVAWVTMKKDGPVVANVLLNGLYNDDLRPYDTEEDGSLPPVASLPMVTGTVRLNGKPAYGLNVTFTPIPGAEAKEEPKVEPKEGDPKVVVPRIAPFGSSRVGSDGGYNVYGNRGGPGLRPGRYAVTFSVAENLIIDTKAPKADSPVPEKYRALSTTPFRVEVTKDGVNKFDFVLE